MPRVTLKVISTTESFIAFLKYVAHISQIDAFTDKLEIVRGV